MKIGPETTLRELAFIVCTALSEAGETAVLSGGGAATVYAPDAYQSKDLDFIFTFWSAIAKPSRTPIEALGFKQIHGTFHHEQSPFTLEFPAGPLAIGNEEILAWETLKRTILCSTS